MPNPEALIQQFMRSLMAAGVTIIGVTIVWSVLNLLAFYLIIKAAVKNGAIAAIHATGLNEPRFATGSPATQEHGAPLPPHRAGS